MEKEDALSRRMRRFIREMNYQSELNEVSLPCARYAFAFKERKFIRIIFLIMFILILLLCGYQIIDRIQYYNTYPVEVDIFIVKKDRLNLPRVMVCPLVTNKTAKYLSTKGNKMASVCMGVGEFWRLLSVPNLSTVEAWDMLNDTDLIINVTLPKKMSQEFESMSKTTYSKTLFGSCKSVHLEKELPYMAEQLKITFFSKKVEGCGSSRYMLVANPAEEPTDFFRANIMSVGLHGKGFMTYKHYLFMNTPQTPCLEENEFYKCKDDCVNRLFRRLISCKYPFMDTIHDLDYCNTSVEIAYNYYYLYRNFTELTSEECGCHRKCVASTPDFIFRINEVGQKDTKVDIFVGSPYVTYVNERFAYDSISLICDIGGNIGLYLGLSMLSLLQLCQTMFYLLKRNRINTTTDPIRRILFRVYQKEIKKMQTLKSFDTLDFSQVIIKQNTIIVKCIWGIIVFLCFIFTGYLIFDRIAYFLSLPIKNIVVVTINKTVDYPIITICGDNDLLVAKKMQYIKEYSSVSCENLTVIDILYSDKKRITKKSLSKWKSYSFNKSNMDIASMSKKMINLKVDLPVLFAEKITEVSLPSVLCSEYYLDSKIYLGKLSFLLIPTKKFRPCGNISKLKVYLTPREGILDLLSFRYIFNGRESAVSFAPVMIKRLNTTKNPCVDAYTSKQCRLQCMEKRLFSRIPCRLPYMPNTFNISVCLYLKEAKTAEAIYNEIYKSTSGHEDCKCLRSCNQIFYNARMYAGGDGLVTTTAFLFVTNNFETIEEINSCTLIKLFCDIGNVLGLTLGLCMISVLDSIFSGLKEIL